MRAKPSAGTLVCTLADIPDGCGRMFVFPVGTEKFRLLVLRTGEQCFGYENYCPHFGVPLADRDDQLISTPHKTVSCNTHYARFRWQDGYCEFGDCAGESLVAVKIAVNGDQVEFA